MTTWVQATDVVLAAVDGKFGEKFAKVILAIIGSFFLVFLIAKLIKAFVEDKLGKAASILGFGAIVAGFIYLPDTSVGLLKDLWELLIE